MTAPSPAPGLDASAAAGLADALAGRGVHADTVGSLEGLTWEQAGWKPDGAPHSVFQLLNHMLFWQDVLLRRLNDEEVTLPPTAAEGWPGTERPGSAAEWDAAVERFRQGVERAVEISRTEDLARTYARWNGRSRHHGLLMVALHNSHHIGQVVLLRRMMGAWPPPRGGDTW